MLSQITLPYDQSFTCETYDGTPSPVELAMIFRLVADRRPKAVFEFGTFRGQTSRLLARHAARVYTLDLPRNLPQGVLPAAADGKYVEPFRTINFGDCPQVRQLFGDSALIDLTTFERRIDLVFVDACHSYEYALNDSLRALAMVRSGGVIVWHDYGTPHWPGVTAALDGLQKHSAAFRALKHVAGTSLAILSVSPTGFCGAPQSHPRRSPSQVGVCESGRLMPDA